MVDGLGASSRPLKGSSSDTGKLTQKAYSSRVGTSW